LKQTNQPITIWPERKAKDWKPFREITAGEQSAILEYFNDETRAIYISVDALDYMLVSNKLMVNRAFFTVYENYFKNGDDLVVMIKIYPTSNQLPGIIKRFRMKNEIITEDDKFEYAWFRESR
jgi:hypothetical protein